MWAGHFDQAAVTLSAAAAAAHSTWQRADCLGHLALLEALRGRLGRAAELAAAPVGAGRDNQARADESSSCAATVAMAYVHVERGELPEARRCLRRADEILQLVPGQADRGGRRASSQRADSWPSGARARWRRWSAGPGAAGLLPPGSSSAFCWLSRRRTWRRETSRPRSRPHAGPARTPPWRRRPPWRARGWPAGTSRPPGGPWPGVPRIGTGSRITSACRPGWPMLSSAMRSATAGARIVCLSGPCGWLRASGCGCRSSSKEAGSVRSYRKTLAWPGPTASC